MYAVIRTGGKQYKVSEGDIVYIEKLDNEIDSVVSFDVLMLCDGENITVGTPTVADAKVEAKVLEHGKEKKVIVFKYKPKKNIRKKQGHRQPYTKVQITSIK